jgi:predicted MPP superfamily phosphohydrolase
MFTTLLLAAGTLLQVYVHWRVTSAPAVEKRISRRRSFAVSGALWLLFLLGGFLGHDASGAVSVALELFTMTWLGTLFLVALCVFAVDLCTGFGWLFRSLAPVARGWAALAGCALALFAVFQGTRAPVVDDFEVRLERLPAALDGTVIVGLSDLHLGAVLGEAWLRARVAQVEALHPDAVVLLGDITEGHGAPSPALLPVMRTLRAPLGVWAVLGNHDAHGGGVAGASLLEQAGFHVLHDRWAEPRPGLIFAGVDDLTARRRAGRMGDAVADALRGRPVGATVLLSHTPWQAEQASQAGVGLMLSGHTHDGQLWPFRYLELWLYPLMSGRYEVGGMSAIVCRGTGTWGPRMRLWLPAEILRITLRSRRAEP